MSDFLKGVGTGLAGSRGIARAVNNFAMAPYIAAIKEQRARSDAAVRALNEVKARVEQYQLDRSEEMYRNYKNGDQSYRSGAFGKVGANPDDLGRAARIDMENVIVRDLLSGKARPEDFRNYNAYNAAQKGKMYSNGNVPGNILSQLGEAIIANRAANDAAVAKLRAEGAKNHAQANSANALAGRHRAETGLVPYRKQKLEAETDRAKNPGHYSRGNAGRSGERYGLGGFTPSPSQQQALKDYLEGKISRKQLEEAR